MSNRENLRNAIQKRDAVQAEHTEALAIVERALCVLQTAIDDHGRLESVIDEIAAWRQGAIKDAIKAGQSTTGIELPSELSERLKRRDDAVAHVANLRTVVEGLRHEADGIQALLARENYNVAVEAEKVVAADVEAVAREYLQKLQELRATYYRLTQLRALAIPTDPSGPETKGPYGQLNTHRQLNLPPIAAQVFNQSPLGDYELEQGLKFRNDVATAVTDHFERLRRDADAEFVAPEVTVPPPPPPPIDMATNMARVAEQAETARKAYFEALPSTRQEVFLSAEAQRRGYRVEGGRIIAPSEPAKATS